MLHSINKYRKCKSGTVAVEFALIAPIFALILDIMIEMTDALHQASIIEKSIFTGCLLLAEGEHPILSADETSVRNYIKYGNTAGTGSYLVPGWQSNSSSLTITTSEITINGSVYPKVTVTASVPFEAKIPSLNLVSYVGNLTFNYSHEHLLAN